MRWTRNPIPTQGDRRTVKKFLFLPLTLVARTEDGKVIRQTRWLEFARIDQVYLFSGKRNPKWKNIAFAN